MSSEDQEPLKAEPTTLSSSPRPIIGWVCRRYNLIQLLGYEFGNLALLAQHGLSPGQAGTFEALAAASFMLGSLSICLFKPEERPSLLFLGGIWLSVGGLMLALAGFPLTGGAVLLASLETARGGLPLMRPSSGRGGGRILFEIARLLMAPYCRAVAATVGRFPGVGGFIQGRPFLASAFIKMPLRLEFVLRNLLVGDAIGVAIGLSWMFGDGALALNDEQLNKWLQSSPQQLRRKPIRSVAAHPAVVPATATYARSWRAGDAAGRLRRR